MEKNPTFGEQMGERMKAERNIKDISARAFAEKIGISYPAYINYENGKRIPSGDILLKIAKGFGVSTDYLLTGDKRTAEFPKIVSSEKMDTIPLIIKFQNHIYRAIEIPKGIKPSDIEPLLDEIQKLLLFDKNVCFHNEKLSDETRQVVSSDVNIMKFRAMRFKTGLLGKLYSNSSLAQNARKSFEEKQDSSNPSSDEPADKK